MAQITTSSTYIAQQWLWKTKFSIDVLRLHQKWGMLSNVMDFYNYNGKYFEWYAAYEKENQEFLEIVDEKELELIELEQCPEAGEFC